MIITATFEEEKTMSLNNFLKGTANILLDSYADAAKRSGNQSSYESSKMLKDVVNGKLDWEGNPICKDDDVYGDE